MSRRAALACLGFLATTLPGVGAARGTLDFLYVEPNVGTASGGHVALRIGDRVYHFQHADGTLRMARDPFDHFRYVYTVLQNRTIHVSRLDAAPDTEAQLRDHFDRRYVVEQEHFAQQRSLRRDRLLLEAALARAERREPASPEMLTLNGPGFFLGPNGRADAGSSPPLAALRERVRRERGEAFLAERLRTLERELGALAPGGAAPPVEISPEHLPPPVYGWSDRVVDLVVEQIALRVLQSAPPLRSEWRLASPAPGLRLDERERAALRDFAHRLEHDLAALLDSERPDRGRPLLLGMARLAVLDESIRSRRLVFLDAFPADAPTLAGASLSGRSAFLEELLGRARTELRTERAAFFATPQIRERHYGWLEEAANRHAELATGLARGRDVRVHGGRMLPHGELRWPARELLPPLDTARLRESLALARAREERRAERLDALYRYDLITRNCATELFVILENAEAGRELGDPIDPHGPLHFWPRFAFRAVNRSWRVSDEGEIPSFRRTRVEQMSAQEHPLWVHLRETNTLTSTVYRPNPRDAFFLFFTEDTVLLRPLYGAANLAAGLGQTALGLLRLPFDRGRALLLGAKGIAFSVPELAFVNVRKGTLEYGRRDPARTALRTAPRARQALAYPTPRARQALASPAP